MVGHPERGRNRCFGFTPVKSPSRQLAENAQVADLEPTRATSPFWGPNDRTTQLEAEVSLGGSALWSPRTGRRGDALQANRSHNAEPRQSTENKCQTPIVQPNSLRRRATLASGNQCLLRSSAGRSARQPAGSLNIRIPCPKRSLYRPPFSSFVRLVCHPPPGPVATGPAPLPPV